MDSLSDVTEAARTALGNDSEEILAAVPTLARKAITMIENISLARVPGGSAVSLFGGLEMMRNRRKNRGASAYVQSNDAHLLVVVRPEQVDIHRLKMPHKAGELIESHPRENFFYEDNPAESDIDTILTIGGSPFYVKRAFGPDLRATLRHHGIEPGLTSDL